MGRSRHDPVVDDGERPRRKVSFKAQQARPRILVTSLFGHQNRGDWELTLALFDVLREAFPACAIHGLCRDPEAESGYFPGVSFGALLGVSTRAAGLRRLLESSISFACGFVATAFGILTGVLPNALARSYREADLIVASPAIPPRAWPARHPPVIGPEALFCAVHSRNSRSVPSCPADATGVYGTFFT